MKPTKQLTDADTWTMRAAVFIFGVYCVTFTLRPIIQKVFLTKSIGMTYVLRKQTRFINLITAGAGVAGLFPFYDLIPHDIYYTVLSFFVGLFFVIETYISYKRVPFQLISPNARTYAKASAYVQIVANICRMCLDLATFIYFYVSSYSHEYYIFVRAVRMAAAFTFAITEISISKITSDLISLPKANMTPETKEILRDTKSKLHALAKANVAGAVAAISEIVNAWFELQMLTALVISAGSVTFVFYGQLFRLGLEDTEKKQRRAEKENAGTRESTKYSSNQPGESSRQSSSISMSDNSV